MKLLASLYISLTTSICLTFTTYTILDFISCYDCTTSDFLQMLIILTITSTPMMISIIAIYNYHKTRLIRKWQLGIMGAFGLFIILISLYWLILDFDLNIVNFISLFIGIVFVTPYLLVRNTNI